MRICLVLEGSYPYVHGGVSTWMHAYIQAMPQQEFSLWVIGAKAQDRGKFVYELPPNVKEVEEVFLDDALRLHGERHPVLFTADERTALRELVRLGRPNWDVLYRLFQEKGVHPLSFLQSWDFMELFTDICMKEYPYVAYADAFHTMRSMLLPVLYLLTGRVPKADVYHAISTGYGGLLACLGGSLNHAPVLLTEHGIYTREREEEIIRAEWVVPSFKSRWIRFFYLLSEEIYRRAFRVSSLFYNARRTQIEMGCNAEKCIVIPNGVQYERFCNIPLKQEDGWVDIGAVVRLAPIKDVKTMIYAFFELASRVPNVRLHIMGGVDDEDYAKECYALVEELQLKNLIFTGRVDVVQYMQKLDFTILTSISEGQPLSVLESIYVPSGAGRCDGENVCQPCPARRDGAHWPKTGGCLLPPRADAGELPQDVRRNRKGISLGVTMAGIGFELKKLFRRKGLFASLRAYGYAGIICTGPMLLGVLLQLGILLLCSWVGAPRDQQDLLVCMITYTLLFSLTVTSFFSMPVTRYLADMLYEEQEQTILPSFWGSSSMMLVLGCTLYGLFLLVSGATLLQGLLCLWLFAEMIVNWNGMSYLTAIKDYRGILCSFLAAIALAFGLGFVLVVLLGGPVLEGMLFAVTMGYGLMMVWDVVLLYRYFPQSEESPWTFLRWVDAFLPLAFTGLCTNIGLFAHLVICWAGPLGVQVKGLFYGAPYYDVPALIAFLTILVTSVNFVVSVEVNFYPKYRNYYSLFNDGGVVGDIVTAEEEMLAVLNRELRFTALKQLFVTAAVLSLENTLLALLPLGFNDLMHGYFRTLCVGYGLYAVGNTVLMILLYFTDYGGAVAAAAVFAVSASGLTALSMAFDPAFYGFGFLIGAALFYLVTLFRLDVFTANLPYRVLGQQPIVAETKAGRFTRLGLFLEHKKRKPTKSAKHSAS